MPMKARRLAFGSLLLLSSLSMTITRESEACGGLYVEPKQEVIAAKIPWLRDERALVMVDSSTKTEHLVREIRFDKSNPRYELVVPVPARPTVERLAKSPFDALENDFFVGPSDEAGTAASSSNGETIAMTADGALAARRFGPLAAYVLPPMRASEADRWLDAHGFSPDSSRLDWMQRYGKLGFHYVVFRYEPTPGDTWGGGNASETVKITFEAKTPYLPYREPMADGQLRRLTVWTISERTMVPVASMGDGTLNRPLRSVGTEFAPYEKLKSKMGELANLLPKHEGAFVSKLRDHKLVRGSYGDVLFVPEAPLFHVIGDGDALLDDQSWIDDQAIPLAILDPRDRDLVSSPERRTSGIDRITRARFAGGAFLAAGLLLGLATIGSKRRRRLFARTLPPFAILGAMSLLSCRREPEVSKAEEARTASTRMHLRLLDGDLSAATLTEDPGVPPQVTQLVYSPIKRSGLRMNDLGAVVGANLAPEVVRRIVRANFPRLRACYQAGLKREPDLYGTITTRFVIGTTGEVEIAAIAELDGEKRLIDPKVDACVLGVFRTISFPEPSKGTVNVVYPIRFENTDA